MRGLGVRVGILEGGSSAETNEAASSGLSFTLSSASSCSITGRRKLIEGVTALATGRRGGSGSAVTSTGTFERVAS